MKKYIFIFFLVGIASNAFAMKRAALDDFRDATLEVKGIKFPISKVMVAQYSAVLKARLQGIPPYVMDEIKEDELSILKFLLDEMHSTEKNGKKGDWSYAENEVKKAYWEKNPSLEQVEEEAYNDAKATFLAEAEAKVAAAKTAVEAATAAAAKSEVLENAKAASLKAKEKTQANVDSLASKHLFYLIKKLECYPEWIKKLVSKNSLLDSLSDRALCQLLGDEIFDPRGKDSKENVLISPLIEKLTDQYKNIGNIVPSESHFLYLPWIAVDFLLSKKDFATDTENSIFSMIIMWTKADQPARVQALEHLVKKIDPRKFTSPYLLNIVYEVQKEFPSLADFYFNALKKHKKMQSITNAFNKMDLGKNVDDTYVNRKNFYENSDKKFAMKVVFGDALNFKQDKKLYSKAIFSNGYYFYFFVRLEQKGIGPAYLAGYLQCSCQKVTSTLSHYLVAQAEIEIERPNGRRNKKIEPFDILFDHFNKSAGVRLDAPDENWESFVFNSTDADPKKREIRVIINVNFPDLSQVKK